MLLLAVVFDFPFACLVFLGCIVIILLLYYFALFGRLVFRKEKKTIASEDLPAVSIIITAHNEAQTIINTLPTFLSQDYPNYEVVLVNDNSKDDTDQIVMELKHRYSHLHYVDLSSSISNFKGKKFPLALGLQAAKNKIVILTDVVCQPQSPYWLQHIVSRFVRNTTVVLGGVTYAKKEGLLNRWLRYNCVMDAIESFSYALAGMPVMANGRNLAYKKELFFNNKETFIAYPRIPYGEDDIFINQVAQRKLCDVEPHAEAFIVQPPINFNTWFRQKKIAFSTRNYYKKSHSFLLKTFNFTSFFFYVAAIIALFFTYKNPIYLSITCGIIVLKLAIHYLVVGQAAKKMNEKGIVAFTLLFDIFLALLHPLINIASKFEEQKWN